MRNIISHNCVGGRIYNKKGWKYGNPFMWCVIPPEDFHYLYSHYNDIDFTKIELVKKGKFYKVVIDEKVNVYYVHYLYDRNATKPRKKSRVDLVYNKMDEYIIEKYKTRLERMSGKPLFIVTDREFVTNPKWSMKKEDIEKYVDKDDCIIAAYDSSINGKNVIHLPEPDLDPEEIAKIILKNINIEEPVETKDILIVNYNTQELTDACIKSINKTSPGFNIHVFDNSDESPYNNTFDNVSVIDNTKGQVIDFGKFLENYPDRMEPCYSSKHCYTIQKFIDMFGKPFILLDSDVLIKKDLSGIWDKNQAFVGEIRGGRVLPFACFINPEIMSEKGVAYFDDDFTFDLNKNNSGTRKYDTGATLFIKKDMLPHKTVLINEYIVHYAAGSYDKVYFNRLHKGQIGKKEWLERHRRLWDNKVIVSTGNTQVVKEAQKPVEKPKPAPKVNRYVKRVPVGNRKAMLIRY